MSVKRWLLAMSCACCAWASGTYAAEPLPTGQFVLPYDENQTVWYNTSCSTPGYVNPWDPGAAESHQYHMELNTGLSTPKYHLGEDWNGKCGSDTDLGAPIFAITDGVIKKIDISNPNQTGNRLTIRYAFPYAKGTGGVAWIDSEYLHLQTIDPAVISKGIEGSVVRGQKVATLGGTGGSVSYSPHLHWDIIWNKALPANNFYQLPLMKADALRYRAPSLIVDDRRMVKTVYPSTFLMDQNQNAPSSTAYISANGVNKSLKAAISAGWIKATDIQYWDAPAGVWRTYANVDDIFFQAGKWYAFWVRVAGGMLNIPIPGNRFQEDRARIDMIHAVETNSMFVSVKTDVWSYTPNWDLNWELRIMGFGRTTAGNGYVAQCTDKSNPLRRYTAIYNNTTNTWGSWVLVDWNRSY